MPSRLAILTSHPIQYNAPLFRHLASLPQLQVKVFYGWEGTARGIDPGFGRTVAWDIPLLEGYDWEMPPNRARDPGTHRFSGLDNPGMIGAIEAFRPDAVLVYGWAWKTHLAAMRHFKGKVPVLLRGDSTLQSSSGGWKKFARMPALRWVYRHVDLALYPGTRNREYLAACGLGEDRMAWMPHAVDNDFFARNDAANEAQALARRRALGIEDDAVVFLYAGKFVPRKAAGLLIAAFEAASRRSSRAHLVLAGTGPMEAELKARAANASNIHFPGFANQSEMPAIYRMGDVLVLPSVQETWGLAVNEAMACGRTALLSSAVGCAPDLAADPQIARVFPAGDGAALGAQMIELAAKKQNLAEMGARAAAQIRNWSIARAAAELTHAVQHAL